MIGSSMKQQYIFDTSAWIEFFEGSAKGEVVKTLLNEKNIIISSDGTFAEIYSWADRNKYVAGTYIQAIRDGSKVFPIYTNIWVEAANHREKMRKIKKDFGQMDALLLAIQDVTGATIVTGDPHFKGLKNVIML